MKEKTKRIHVLKTWPKFFDYAGEEKRFEIRKNDRGFAVGDILVLLEYDPKSNRFTGREKSVVVEYILPESPDDDCSSFGIVPGFCIMSIKSIGISDEKELKNTNVWSSKFFLATLSGYMEKIEHNDADGETVVFEMLSDGSSMIVSVNDPLKQYRRFDSIEILVDAMLNFWTGIFISVPREIFGTEGGDGVFLTDHDPDGGRLVNLTDEFKTDDDEGQI